MRHGMATPEWVETSIPEWDDPIWYHEDGELRDLKHLWYASERVKQYVLESLAEDEIPRDRRWHDISNGNTKYTSAVFVDKFFCKAGLPSFHVALGSPDVANAAPPGSGTSNPEARYKLPSDVRFEIRRRKRAGESTMNLAAEFGVSRRHVQRV
jgi:hypothetical protein